MSLYASLMNKEFRHQHSPSKSARKPGMPKITSRTPRSSHHGDTFHLGDIRSHAERIKVRTERQDLSARTALLTP
jgi:hypothetical protein